ncbi:hypothetical protein BU15DRAFT_61409 [Melanogaster broomeanus]|nr:hypothetical protein BU15DRAFT_61409 [Melanogaster broomeanus]
MSSWTQTSTTSGQRVWTRALGALETFFYWYGVFNGAVDTVMHIHLRATRPSDTDIYSRDNVRRAWLSVKRRFPLLAAEVQEEDAVTPTLLLREENVVSLREWDVTFARLQMYHPLESGIRLKDVTPAKLRWRKALGHAGGHTLPGNFTAATQLTPAKARRQIIGFSRELSALILSNCRRHNVTLNSAYYVLSQVALSRLLCRRYLRGEISEEEWQYRKREPMFFTGPLNLRPYQDQDWLEKGGLSEVGLNVSALRYILPFHAAWCNVWEGCRKLGIVGWGTAFRGPHVIQSVPPSEMAKEVGLTWRGTGERVVQNPNAQQSTPVHSLGPIPTQGGSSLGNATIFHPYPSSLIPVARDTLLVLSPTKSCICAKLHGSM